MNQRHAKTLNQIEKRIAEILDAKEKELAELARKKASFKASYKEAETAMKAALASGGADPSSYMDAKARFQAIENGIEYCDKRAEYLENSGRLVSEEEHEKTVKQILDLEAEAERIASEKIVAAIKVIEEACAEANEVTNAADKLMLQWQNGIHSRLDINGQPENWQYTTNGYAALPDRLRGTVFYEKYVQKDKQRII